MPDAAKRLVQLLFELAETPVEPEPLQDTMTRWFASGYRVVRARVSARLIRFTS